MSRFRPAIAAALFAIVTLAVIGVAALALRGGGFGPWAFALTWQQMDAGVETQVLSSTDVALEIAPDREEFSGRATIRVGAPGGAGGEVFLLLNPGLAVTEVRCDGEPVSMRRHRERLRVILPPGTSSCVLTIDYTGWPVPANGSALVLGRDEILIDKLQFWYPVDLKSFGDFSASMTVPGRFEVAWSGTLLENHVQGDRRRIAWREARPILASGLALGVYERHSRVQGSIRCNIFGADLSDRDAELSLAALGDAYNNLSARLGPDNFTRLNLVISASVDSAAHAGGSLILAPPEILADPDALFATLAAQVARNWWGETVSARWFSARPEAGEWLHAGLSEYSAWQALRYVKGRRAYLRHMETRIAPPRLDAPLKSYNLGGRLKPGPGEDAELLRVRGAFTAAMLSTYVGGDAFDRACKNFLSVHRHSTVSFGALLHEITLASEVPLDELVRVWFDRPGTFDYEIAAVATEPNQVHVTIANRGDMPAYVPMRLGIVTGSGYHVQDVRPGGHRDTYTIPVDGAVQRVVLDPEFELGDMVRANNTWPRTEWPVSLAVGPNGRMALASRAEWGSGQLHLSIFNRMDRSPEFAMELDALPEMMRWDSEGRTLALWGPKNGTWSEGRWTPLGSDRQTPLGWRGGEMVTWEEVGDGEHGGAPQAPPRCVAIDPESGDVAFTTAGGQLVLRPNDGSRTLLLREGVYPAEHMAWRAGARALVYFERGGSLVSIGLDEDIRTVLLHRNYEVKRSRISGQGAYVAWVDPAGLLRAIPTGGGDPVYVSLPGEIVDFAWEGEAALVALVATVPRRLPMLYHADYSLWRIPVSTWEGVQLPYDPVAFARHHSDDGVGESQP